MELEIGIWKLELEIEIRNWDWKFELGIFNWNSKFEFGIGNCVFYLELSKFEFRIRILMKLGM